ncbi:MAG: Coenzyme F420 hydrogenase/dehydrogenase, beta subunit C-terminal domain [Prevotellaceae bacterium]|nr:Coenzyme F420 hydrogenase/dehydrogenase, beta subunit C-terminal domain [Prevotellaceae bacterium]
MNIKLATTEQCTGCASCYNACNKQAVSMIADSEGFLHPQIDEGRCIGCGMCEKSCPVIIENGNDNEFAPHAYAVWSVLDRARSSSGGAFSAFARLVLSKGGYVFGASFDEMLHCRHIEVKSIEQLESLRGSKYVQSEIGLIYRRIKGLLRDDKYVLFCGTPCQVAGLYAFLHKDYDHLLTLDLVCHGVPSDELFHAYISKVSSRLSGQVNGFEFRRRDGWGKAPSISLSGKLIPLYGVNNLYMEAFDKNAIFRKSCYTCKFADVPRIGDCTIGDFWGIGRHGSPFKHNVDKGVSLVLTNNARGREFLEQLDEADVFVEERDLSEALIENHNILHQSVSKRNRDGIVADMLNSNVSLDEIEKKYKLVDKSLKGIIKRIGVKYHLFPILKSFYNKIIIVKSQIMK